MAPLKTLPFHLVRVMVVTEGGVCQNREARRAWAVLRRPLEGAVSGPDLDLALPKKAPQRGLLEPVWRPAPRQESSSTGQGHAEQPPDVFYGAMGEPLWTDDQTTQTELTSEPLEAEDPDQASGHDQGQDQDQGQDESESEDQTLSQCLLVPVSQPVAGVAARAPSATPFVGASCATQVLVAGEAQARSVSPLAAVTRAVEDLSLVQELADWLVHTCQDEACRNTGPWEFAMPLKPFGLGDSFVDLHLSPALLSLRFRCDDLKVSRLLCLHRDRLLTTLRERLTGQPAIELTVVDA